MSTTSRDLNCRLTPSENNVGPSCSSPDGSSISGQEALDQRKNKKRIASKGKALFSLISKKCKIKSTIDGNKKSLWYSMGSNNSKIQLSCELEDFTTPEEELDDTKNIVAGKVEVLLVVSSPCDKKALSSHDKSPLPEYQSSETQENEPEARATKLYCVFNSDDAQYKGGINPDDVAKGDIESEIEK